MSKEAGAFMRESGQLAIAFQAFGESNESLACQEISGERRRTNDWICGLFTDSLFCSIL